MSQDYWQVHAGPPKDDTALDWLGRSGDLEIHVCVKQLRRVDVCLLGSNAV
jgi:hypothetical protein